MPSGTWANFQTTAFWIDINETINTAVKAKHVPPKPHILRLALVLFQVNIIHTHANVYEVMTSEESFMCI
jgi:hypothetical protein